MCGDGAALWTHDGAGRWTNADRVLHQSALIAQLRESSNCDASLLQRRLKNHSAIADLGPSGLCTVRVVTTRDPQLEHSTTLLAVFRMPTGGDVADNFARGGWPARWILRH